MPWLRSNPDVGSLARAHEGRLTVTTGMQTVNFDVLDCGYQHIEPALGDPDYFFPVTDYTENFGTAPGMAYNGTVQDAFRVKHDNTWYYNWDRDPFKTYTNELAVALPMEGGWGTAASFNYSSPYTYTRHTNCGENQNESCDANHLPACPILGQGAVTLLMNEPDNCYEGGSGMYAYPPLCDPATFASPPPQATNWDGEIGFWVAYTHKLLTQCPNLSGRRWATPAIVRGEQDRLNWLTDWWDTYVYSYTNSPKDDGVEYMAVHCYEFTPTGGSPETGKCADPWMPNAVSWANNHGLRGVILTEYGAPYTITMSPRLTETIAMEEDMRAHTETLGLAWFTLRNPGPTEGLAGRAGHQV